MLQARRWICILLLAAIWLPAGSGIAQDDENTQQGRIPTRLGDLPVDDDLDLQLTVPVQENSPADPATGPVAEREASPEEMIAQKLEDAEAAMRDGRVDRPAEKSAWTYYRVVLEMDPDNDAALRGLANVQEFMVSSAVEAARELDFEAAARMLEEASRVRESRELIDTGEQEIAAIKFQHIKNLETRAVQAMDAGDFEAAERELIELIAVGNAEGTVKQLRRRLEEARTYGKFRPGQVIKDPFINQGHWSPETVIVLAGSFVMGSSDFEEGREENEGPTHRVSFGRGFAIGRTEVTVKQFRQFVSETRYRTDAEKQRYSMIYNHHSGRLAKREGVNWKMSYEGKDAGDDDPVVHVSWNDATAYAQWLARGTGKAYRLPSEAEFEYALRGGKTTRYWWGDGAPQQKVENLTGEGDLSPERRQWSSYFKDYEDGFWGPAPVASFDANPFQLHDMGGNVAEWVSDCWHNSYLRAPVDGSAWINPGCKLRTLRGGYWASSPDQARSAYRQGAKPDRRDALTGFRIARDL